MRTWLLGTTWLVMMTVLTGCTKPTPTLVPTASPRPTRTPTPAPTPHQITTGGGQWNLVWADEFDQDGLPDWTKWDYEVGAVRNNEAQYYTSRREKNARIENDMLIIEAHQESFSNMQYTSASLTTRSTATWRYGRIEVRAKLPTGRGMWPAIWMLGANIDQVGWPRCGEIDIMENVGFDPNRIYGSIHTAAYNHADKTGKGGQITIKAPYDEFHVYAIEWFAGRIDFFVDEQKYFTFKNEGTGVDAWPYDAPQYLILNIAVGGSWGGQKGIDSSIFPQRMYVDYVRVYQAAP